MTMGVKQRIKKDHKKFNKRIDNLGGWKKVFHGFAAQLLWLTLIYKISIFFTLLFINNPLTAHTTLAVIFVLLAQIWKILKNKLPDYLNDIITGEFIYEFSLKTINLIILSLALFHLLFIFGLKKLIPTHQLYKDE